MVFWGCAMLLTLACAHETQTEEAVRCVRSIAALLDARPDACINEHATKAAKALWRNERNKWEGDCVDFSVMLSRRGKLWLLNAGFTTLLLEEPQ